MQRFTWDLLYPNPSANSYDLPISAIYKDTPWVPQGPAVLPGVYNVSLTVDGRKVTQKLTVRIDPRVKTSAIGLKQQFDLSIEAYQGIGRSQRLVQRIEREIALLEQANPSSPKIVNLKLLLNGSPPKPGTSPEIADLPLNRLAGAFTQLLDLLQDADVAPSTQAVKAARELQLALTKAVNSLPPDDL